jgi:two-component system, LytTR family, sensor kinase
MYFFNSKKGLPSFWTIQIIGWIVYFVAIYITFLTVAQPERFLMLFYLKGFRALTGFFLTSLFMRPIYLRLAGRLSIQWLVLLVLACSVAFGCAWTAIEGVYVQQTSPSFDLTNYLMRSPRLVLDYAMTLTAWSALYLGVKNWWSWQNERENALEAAALANKAQLEMLRYQLNPHFLFNSLNSIRASIDEDSNRAKQMVTQLAEFLRYSLLNCDEKEVPLREEIEATRNYLAIEKTRFEDKLEVAFEVDERAEELLVPCFLLNPLVENAVKHGLNGGAKPLRILVSAKIENNALKLEVSNTGSLNGNGNGTKVGLKNVRERLEKLFAERSNFDLKEEHGWVRAQILIQGN